MNENDYTTEENERAQTLPDNIRYSYFGSRVEINGVGFPVVAAIPFGRMSRALPTATDKLKILAEGK